MTAIYEWNDRKFPTQSLVAMAAGVHPGLVSRHMTIHGNLNRLGLVRRPPKTAAARARSVRRMLREGYGAEDIARAYKLPADDVRAVIADMRASGELAAMWPKSGGARQ